MSKPQQKQILANIDDLREHASSLGLFNPTEPGIPRFDFFTPNGYERAQKLATKEELTHFGIAVWIELDPQTETHTLSGVKMKDVYGVDAIVVEINGDNFHGLRDWTMHYGASHEIYLFDADRLDVPK